jgi:uncharacterized protein YcfJ
MRFRCFVLIAAGLSLSVGQAEAQNVDFAALKSELRANDSVIVEREDGTVVKGRVLNLSVERLTLRTDDISQDLTVNQVVKIQRRRNGIVLGALIGAAVGVPFGLALRSYAQNEGGSEGGALAFPIAVGVGRASALMPSWSNRVRSSNVSLRRRALSIS